MSPFRLKAVFSDPWTVCEGAKTWSWSVRLKPFRQIPRDVCLRRELRLNYGQSHCRAEAQEHPPRSRGMCVGGGGAVLRSRPGAMVDLPAGHARGPQRAEPLCLSSDV